MSEFSGRNLSLAIEDFRRARRHAAMESVLSRLSGKPEELLSFEDVSKLIRLSGAKPPRLENILLDSIVGSVGRYEDFNRNFLPLSDGDEQRWAFVRSAMEEKGLPPIEAYQIGDAYFVFDGNHRVSIARQMGSKSIEAFVTEFRSSVTLSPDDDFEDVILKAEKAELLEDTGLEKACPEIDFTLTMAGRYREIFEHIAVHRYFLGDAYQRHIPMEEAAYSWVTEVYLPVVNVIRDFGLLRDFPGRTEADLYLWLKRHQSELSDQLGWRVETGEAAERLRRDLSRRPGWVWERLFEGIKSALVPKVIAPARPPGNWKRVWRTETRPDQLFSAILVALTGKEEDWFLLDQAILIAKHERATLRGLHVVSEETQLNDPVIQAIETEFYRRCVRASVDAEFSFQTGDTDQTIVQRAAWNDLVMVRMRYPPGSDLMGRFTSGIRKLILNCPRPLLIVPAPIESIQKIVLAYDGSSTADQALYLSAYLANGWDLQTLVCGLRKDDPDYEIVERKAKEYFERYSIESDYRPIAKNTAASIVAQAREFEADMIVMGGYGSTGFVNLFTGSLVDEILRRFNRPVLICR